MTRRILGMIFLAAIFVFTSACSAAPTQPPAPTQAPAASETPRPSETPIPSSTPVPSSTQTPPPTATQADTPTVKPSETSTPRPSFAGFAVEYVQPASYGLLFGFHIPGIKENYRLMVNEKEYKCDLNAKSPDRLGCYGPAFTQGQTVKLSFLPLTGDNQPVYETTYKIALIGTPTLEPTALYAAAKACLIRGVHVTCETEYRRLNDSYCIVATCADLCGYYYSVDTCPVGSEHNGIFQFTGTPPLPPSHY